MTPVSLLPLVFVSCNFQPPLPFFLQHRFAVPSHCCFPQIECFCNQQMQPYSPLFPQGSMQAQLDQIDRRFAWFRRLLRGVDLRFDGVFPKHWRLQHRLCMRFLTQTRTVLAELLEGGSKETEDVTVLLKVAPTLPRCNMLCSRRNAAWRLLDFVLHFTYSFVLMQPLRTWAYCRG